MDGDFPLPLYHVAKLAGTASGYWIYHADAIIIFIAINMPYVDEITEFRSSSKSHNNVRSSNDDYS